MVFSDRLKRKGAYAWRQHLLLAVLWCALLSLACEQVAKPPQSASDKTVGTNANTEATNTEPTIEANPTSKSDDQWQVVSSDTVTLTVSAPQAQSVRILYRPAFAEDRHVVLKNVTSPADQGKFTTQLKVPPDFAGQVWAEASYPGGEKKETKPISLTVESISPGELADASYKHVEDSARSDKITGGRIERASLQPGNGDIRITINIPAFQLTLWQGGKEVKTYAIGIGRNEFPLPDGLRRANQIIFNPEWVPPDSSWVEDHDVVPGERVEADDPRNPLGKLKIPLGKGGILIHQASRPSDLGHLVSHGCARLLLKELYELVDEIIAARSAKVSPEQLEHAKTSKDRLMIKLDTPVIVDISYDTIVVEGGLLHLYPDVYNKGTNTPENIRRELQDAHVDAANLDDNQLQQMLARVTKAEEFTVNVADIKTGRALAAGQNQPLVPGSAPKKQAGSSSKAKRRK
jgi:lipoprotein-anchoring transpeptidase ErfK/SrfK